MIKNKLKSFRKMGVGLSAAALALSMAVPAFAGYKEFDVTTTSDTHDASPGNGDCADSNGRCSLRAAVEEANALTAQSSSNSTAIYLDEGRTYYLWRTSGASGGSILPITGNVRISISSPGNSSSRNAIITKSSTSDYRVIGLYESADVNLTNITVKNGRLSRADGGGICGGGILIEKNTSLYGSYLNVTNNKIYNGYGGGICNRGSLTLEMSNISNNLSTDDSVNSGQFFVGGGLYNKGRAELYSSSVMDNEAVRGGGVYTRTVGDALFDGEKGGLILRNSTVSGNKSQRDGAAVYVEYGEASISFSTIVENDVEQPTGSNAAITVSGFGYSFDENYQASFSRGQNEFISGCTGCHGSTPITPQNYSYESLTSKISNTMIQYVPGCDRDCAQDIAYYLTQQYGEGGSSAPFYDEPEFSIWGSIIAQNRNPQDTWGNYNCNFSAGSKFSNESGYNVWGNTSFSCGNVLPSTDTELTFSEEQSSNLAFTYVDLKASSIPTFSNLFPNTGYNWWFVLNEGGDTRVAIPATQDWSLFPSNVPGTCGGNNCSNSIYGYFDGAMKYMSGAPFSPGAVQLR